MDLKSGSLETDLKNGSLETDLKNRSLSISNFYLSNSHDVPKKNTKVLDIFNTGKKCYIKKKHRIKYYGYMDKDAFS